MNNTDYINILVENFKNIVPYYQVIPSFLFSFSLAVTNEGNSECVSKANNLFNLDINENWLSNNGNYLNIKNRNIRSYDVPYESMVDFCETNKSWILSNNIEDLFKYINTNVEELNSLSSVYKDVSVKKLKDLINKYDLSQYNDMITDEYLSSSCGVRFYTLKAGDSLREIAMHFNTSVSTIVRLNNIIKLNDLQSGRTIKII